MTDELKEHLKKNKHMILTEIITEDRYKFLKLWYSCKWMIWDKFPESIFMVRGEKVLFEQDWKSKYLWCKHSDVWSFFEAEFGYNYSQIKQMISNILEEHLKQGVLTPTVVNFVESKTLEEHLKQGVLTPYSSNKNSINMLEEHLKQGAQPILH